MKTHTLMMKSLAMAIIGGLFCITIALTFANASDVPNMEVTQEMKDRFKTLTYKQREQFGRVVMTHICRFHEDEVMNTSIVIGDRLADCQVPYSSLDEFDKYVRYMFEPIVKDIVYGHYLPFVEEIRGKPLSNAAKTQYYQECMDQFMEGFWDTNQDFIEYLLIECRERNSL